MTTAPADDDADDDPPPPRPRWGRRAAWFAAAFAAFHLAALAAAWDRAGRVKAMEALHAAPGNGVAVQFGARSAPTPAAEAADAWREWTGMSFPESGSYEVPGALQPVSRNVEEDLGVYEEPNVWMRHTVPKNDGG